jgi:hypothetical protein
MDTDSFTMWLIDKGVLDGCKLGEEWEKFRDADTAYYRFVLAATEYGEMSLFHRYMAKRYPREYTTWKTIRRLLCS